MERTVIVESIKMNVVRRVVEVEERLTVRPALEHDATGLRVEWEECSVEMT